MGFDQQLKSGVPSMSENHPLQPPVPNMYTPQSMRTHIRNQPMSMQRPMRPLIRPPMSHVVNTRGRGSSNIQRTSSKSITKNCR